MCIRVAQDIPIKLECFATIESNSANQMAKFLDGRNFDWLKKAAI